MSDMDRPAIEPIARAERPIAAGTYPTRADLADAVRRLQAVDWPLRQLAARPKAGDQASGRGRGTHEAVYISDPDGNDLELYGDRPQSEWALDEHGHLAFAGGELDLEDLPARR
jgi:catechol 2,3-dioxygenase